MKTAEDLDKELDAFMFDGKEVGEGEGNAPAGVALQPEGYIEMV